MNRFGAALSTAADLSDACAQVTEEALKGLGGTRPSLALFFANHEHAAGFDDLARRLRSATGADFLLGATGETIVGGGREIEEGPSLSLWLANFPQGEVETFHLEIEQKDDEMQVSGFPGIEPGTDVAAERVSMLLMAEPYSFPADLFLRQLNEQQPGLEVVGGMASGSGGPGTNRLFCDDESLPSGAVGAILRGVSMKAVVSQGCRPVGRSMVITKSHENVIEELAGKTPLEQLRKIYEEAGDDEKLLLQRAMKGGGLHIGQVVDEKQSSPSRGDFLVRNVMGADQKSGSMQIGDHARRGRTVRFHVRDAVSADEDLKHLLGGAKKKGGAGGALLFTCNGRGTRFFEVPDHDAASLQQQLGPIPAAGLFAAGEIGPVGGKNFLHGFTASIALFAAE